MTAIIGLRADDGAVWMGADSCCATGYYQMQLTESKIFRKEGMLFGTSGSVRSAQILGYNFTPPRRWPDQGAMTYLCGAFMQELRTVLRANGGLVKSGEAENLGVSFLLAYEKKLYDVYNDGSVVEVAEPYNATGCGYSYALGSLYSTHGQAPADRVRIALEAAERFSMGVRGPYDIQKL